MSFVLGGVTFGAREQPYEWEFGTDGEDEWAESNPYGYVGRIMRRRHTDAAELPMRCRLTNATKVSVQALATAGSDVTFTWDDTDIGGSAMTVTIKKFIARKTRDTYLRTAAAAAVWDCEIVLVVT
jgi:hypothetical protein